MATLRLWMSRGFLKDFRNQDRRVWKKRTAGTLEGVSLLGCSSGSIEGGDPRRALLRMLICNCGGPRRVLLAGMLLRSGDPQKVPLPVWPSGSIPFRNELSAWWPKINVRHLKIHLPPPLESPRVLEEFPKLKKKSLKGEAGEGPSKGSVARIRCRSIFWNRLSASWQDFNSYDPKTHLLPPSRGEGPRSFRNPERRVRKERFVRATRTVPLSR